MRHNILLLSNERNFPVTGFYQSVLYLGIFIGATLGGFIVEKVGFAHGVEIFIFPPLVLFCYDLFELFYVCCFSPIKNYEQLEGQ